MSQIQVEGNRGVNYAVGLEKKEMDLRHIS